MDHEGIRRLVGDLNRLYAAEPALGANDFNPHGFRWINCLDADANLIAYLRTRPRPSRPCSWSSAISAGRPGTYRIGVPRRGLWKEVINTNSEYYGGSGLGQ